MTTPESGIDPPALEVHVLGGGEGESVVIKLPDGGWGVVDCYSRDEHANPTIQYLRERGVRTLLFVCLTHAHDDHFLGMVKLIEEFKPLEFWRFGCLSPAHVAKLLQYSKLRSKEAGGVKGRELTRSTKELFDIFALARAGAESGAMRVQRLTSRMTIYPLPRDDPPGLVIECLSPTGRQIERYESAILECVGPDDQIARNLEHSRHNDVSVVLKITHGAATIILGGDLEAAGWKEVVEEYGEQNMRASAVKVSHHGSENGYRPGLWQYFSASGKPIAVIAPRHRCGLPKPAALTVISRHAGVILATCRPKLEWKAPLPRGGTDPPLESRTAMRAQLSAKPLVVGVPCGRCGLRIDNIGNVSVELADPAVCLTG